MEQPKIAQPWCISHEDKFKRMEHTLYGNGKEGLLTRFNRLETTLVVSGRWVKLIALGLVPVILNAVVALYEIIKGLN